jgi:hypothetical protein
MPRDQILFTVEITKTVSSTLSLVEFSRTRGDVLEYNSTWRDVFEAVRSIVSKPDAAVADMMARATIKQ